MVIQTYSKILGKHYWNILKLRMRSGIGNENL